MRRILPVVCLLLSPALAGADMWDVQTQNDNSASTENGGLVHGSDQFHDLGVLPGPTADQDYYRIRQQPYSSYEIVVDATSGDIGQTLRLERLVDGGTVVESSMAAGIGYSRSLRIRNCTGRTERRRRNPARGQAERGAVPSTNCGPDDGYRIRAFDTTYSIPRRQHRADRERTS